MRVRSPTVFAPIHIQCTGSDAQCVIAKQPHVATVLLEGFLNIVGEIVPSIYDHAYSTRGKPRS